MISSAPPTGWVPDTPDPRDWRFEESRIAAARPIITTETIDFRHLDVRKVQLFPSCVGHAVAASAALCMAIAGKPIAFPSAQHIWTGARILEQDPAGLQFVGCQPRLAITWGRDRGFVAETRWPETLANANTIPTLDVWQEGDAAQLRAFYAIAEGETAPDAVDAALSRGKCPAFAMDTDTKYERIGRQIYDGPGGASIGGHMQVVVGRLRIGNVLVFVIRNTWPNFGDEGYAYMTRDAFGRMARNIWVIDAVPEIF